MARSRPSLRSGVAALRSCEAPEIVDDDPDDGDGTFLVVARVETATTAVAVSLQR